MYPRTKGSFRLTELESLGWNDRLSSLYEPFAGDDVVAGRVSIQHRGAYDVLTEQGELRCEVPRRLVHEAATIAELPVVGDWVVVAPGAEPGTGTITAVLPRFTKFSRKTAWQATEEQVLAANIDVAFLVASMNEDLSLRRLERYLILAWESGARPVIVLTKADLHPAPEIAVAEVETIAGGVPVHAISSVTGEGLDEVTASSRPGSRRCCSARPASASRRSSTRSRARSCSRPRRSATTARGVTRRRAGS